MIHSHKRSQNTEENKFKIPRSIKSISSLIDNILKDNKQEITSKDLTRVYILAAQFVKLYMILSRSYASTRQIEKECALEYVSKIIRGKSCIPSNKVLASIVSLNISQERKQSRIHELELDRSYELLVDDFLVVRDYVKKSVSDCPVSIQFLILYFLNNPGTFYSYLNSGATLKKVVIIKRLAKLKSLLMKETDLPINIPGKTLNRLVILSGIYKLSPPALILLTLFEDFPKLLQFLSLFSETKLKLPKAESVINQVKITTNILNKHEASTSLSEEEEKYLALIATDIGDIPGKTDDVTLSPVIKDYMERIIESSINSFNEISDRAIRATDYSNPESVSRVYKLTTGEIANQIKLLERILSSITTSQELQELKESLKP